MPETTGAREKPMLRIAMLAMLLASPAAAQNLDYKLPDGSVVHRRVISGQQCIRISRDPNGFWDWDHDGPCSSADIAEVNHWHITFYSRVTKAQMERAFTLKMIGSIRPKLKHILPIGDCVHLPATENLEKEYFVHAPPCSRAGDIGRVDQKRHIVYRQDVTKEQLQYGFTMALHIFSGWPIIMRDFAEFHPEEP
jgi:hypothetical protein